MKCEFCNGETRPKKVRMQHWFNNRLYIVDDVLAEVCRNCGERYYHATTLDKIDQMLSSEHPVKEHLDVEVVSMESVA